MVLPVVTRQDARYATNGFDEGNESIGVVQLVGNDVVAGVVSRMTNNGLREPSAATVHGCARTTVLSGTRSQRLYRH